MRTIGLITACVLAVGCSDHSLVAEDWGQLYFSPEAIFFDISNRPVQVEVELQNVGKGDLEILETFVEEQSAGQPYSVPVTQDGTLLEPLDRVWLTVEFVGDVPGTGLLVIRTDDAGQRRVEIPLSTKDVWGFIAWPPDETWKVEGQGFDFQGQVGTTEGDVDAVDVRWVSDVDGELHSETVDVDEGLSAFTTTDLTPGQHVITLFVDDPDSSAASETSVAISVLDCEDDADYDGDGYSTRDGDCDDFDATVHPGRSMDIGDTKGACQGGEVVAIHGEHTDDHFGFSFGDAGDINGDGLLDLAMSARDHQGTGAVYLLMGTANQWGTHLEAETLTKLTPAVDAESMGHNTSAAVDLNGDGLDEVMANAEYETGVVWVWYGREGWLDQTSDDADVRLDGAEGAHKIGEDITSGDFDGDGYGDLVLGGSYLENVGRVWMVKGGRLNSHEDLDYADLTITGEDLDHGFGSAVAQAGDVDGDGRTDLLVAAEDADFDANNAGAVHLFTDLRGAVGAWSASQRTAVWVGQVKGDRLGTHDLISRAGDIDHDGFQDLLFVAAGHDGDSPDVGQVYLVRGGDHLEGEYQVGDTPWSWVGDGGGDLYGGQGEGLAWAGDVDGDGIDDFMVGADDDDHNAEDAGRVYLFLGRSQDEWEQDVPLRWADRLFHGLYEGSFAGRAVAGTGDMDGNGLDDFVLGAHGEDQGTAYLYLNDYGYCPEDEEE